MKRGFTLIELLVVIAIIGILASIVLVSFPGATAKAHDTRIISAIGQARTVMAYVKANDGDYDLFTETTPASDMVALDNEVDDQGGDLIVVRNAASSASAACMHSVLNETGKYYCSDSTGVAGKTSINPNTATYCVADTTAVCPAFD